MSELLVENLLDVELLTGYVDNLSKDIVQQMIDLYIQQSEIYLAEIESAVQAESNALWQECCHKMKGAVGSVGFKVLHRKLVEIERSVANKEEKLIELNTIISMNKEGISMFNQWLNAIV